MRLDSFLGKMGHFPLETAWFIAYWRAVFCVNSSVSPLRASILDNLLSWYAFSTHFPEKTVCFFSSISSWCDGTIVTLFQNGFPTCFVFSITCSISFSNAILASNRKSRRRNWRRCRKKIPTGTAGADIGQYTGHNWTSKSTSLMPAGALFSWCACLTITGDCANILSRKFDAFW